MRMRLGLIGLAWTMLACHGGSGSTPVDANVVFAGIDAMPDIDSGVGLGQVDRAGHPLAAVLLVPGALQNDYNAEPSFESNVPRVLQEALESRLEALDTIALGDGGPDLIDWPIADGGTHPLLPVFTTDVLLVDTGLACSAADGGFASSYLEVEREIYLNGPSHVTCGGRTPNDNVVDTTLTLLGTNNRVPVSQGVAGPTKPATTAFPYLAAPN
jgi:hypothetical protein